MPYSVNINFTAANPVPQNGYRVRYRPQGSLVAYTEFTTVNTTFLLTGLTDGVSYEVFVASLCAGAGEATSQLIVNPPFATTTTSTTTTSTTAGTTTSTSSTTTTTTTINFNTILDFTSASQTSAQGVTGTIGAPSSVVKFAFNLINPRVGIPNSMDIYLSSVLVMVVDFSSDYAGQPFRFTGADGINRFSNFTNGQINF